MPFNGSGGFDPLPPPDFPAVDGTTIYASQFNNVIQDILTGLGQTINRAGTGLPTANLPMGGFKHTGAASATANGEYLVYGQSQPAALGAALSVTGQITGSANIPLVLTPPSIAGTYLRMNVGGSSSHLFYLGSDGGAAASGGSGSNTVLRAVGQLRLEADGGSVLMGGLTVPTGSERLHVNGEVKITKEGATLRLAGTSLSVIEFYRTGWGTRTAYVGCGSPANQLELVCNNGPVRIYSNDILAATWTSSQDMEAVGKIYPATNGVRDLGQSSFRWATVYGVDGNFSGDVTVGDDLTVGDRVTATGMVVAAGQPAFSSAGSPSVINAVSSTEVTWPTGETLDVGGNFDPSTGRFTAPVAGTYYFSVLGRGVCDSTGVGRISVNFSLRKNGLSFAGLSSVHTSYGTDTGTFTPIVTLSSCVSLAAGDYVSVHADSVVTTGSISYVQHIFSNFTGFLL